MANSEHLKILKQGVKVWNEWRDGRLRVLPDLRHAHLGHAHLSQANLSFTDLSYADLRRADLTGANLSRADFNFAALSGADYTNVIDTIYQSQGKIPKCSYVAVYSHEGQIAQA